MRWPIRPVAGNVVVLVGGHLTARLLYLGLAGLIARVHGAEALGGFALAAVLGMLALFLTDLGLTPALIRDIAADPSASGRLYAESTRAKVFLLVVALGALPLMLHLLPFRDSTLVLTALFLVAGLVESFAQLNTGVCRAHRRMAWEAGCAGVQAIVMCGLSGFFLLTGRALWSVGVAAVVGALAELVLSVVLRRRLVLGGKKGRPTQAVLRDALPYGVTSLTATAFFQLDVVLLSFIVTQGLLGEYSAVTRLLHGATFAIGMAAAATLPAVTHAVVTLSTSALRHRIKVVLRWVLLAAVTVAAAAFLLARPVMALVYGERFAGLAPLLALAGLNVGLRLVADALGTLLTAGGRQRTVALARLGGTVLTWVLIIPLVLTWGLTGAVVSLLVGEGISLLLILHAATGSLALGWIRAPVTGQDA